MSDLTATVQSFEYGVEEAEVENGYQYDPASDSLPAIDLTLAAQYITALTGSLNTPVTWQVFRDDANVKSVASNWTATLAAATPELIRLNKAGQGIFVTVSETDSKGRSKGNCIAPRALFLDFDDKDEQFIDEDKLALLPKPSAKIRSGGGYHLYWFLNPDEPLDALEPALGQLIQYMGGDIHCKDMGRVMRVPGFLHQKAKKGEKPNPFLVTICYSKPEIRYSLAEVVAGIPVVASTGASTRKSKKSNTLSLPFGKNKGDFDTKLAKLVADIKDAPNGSRNTAINTGTYSLAGQFPDKLDVIEKAVLKICKACGDDMVKVKSALKSALKTGAENPYTPEGGGGGEGNQRVKLEAIDVGTILAEGVLNETKFDAKGKQWWIYDGHGKWNPVGDEWVYQLATAELEDSVQISTSGFLDRAIRFAKGKLMVQEWIEADNLRYIPFTNGVLDLKGNQFLEHSPEYKLTWQLPRAHSTHLGEWSHIDRFLDTLANNDPELKMLAVAFCNAVLKGRSDLQKSLYLFGSGANGKGAYITLLEMLIGKENIHSTSMGELNTNRFEPANIRGKRLVMMPDEDKYGGGLNVFKAATGGNPVKFERKGENASTFLFQGVMVIAANKPTFLGNSDGGMGRRIVSFPCKSVVAAKDRRNMSPLFDADLTAFTSYLLSLDDNWVSDIIHNAGTINAVKELATELAIRGDSVAAFYHAQLELNPKGECSCGGLYEAYREYCQAAGVSAKGLNNFTPDLMEYCNTRQGGEVAKKRTKGGMVLTGITRLGSVPE